MKILFIINDAPYGTERAYNALRMAMQIQRDSGDVEVRIFLMADAAFCAMSNQKTPDGYYNIERMLRAVIRRNGEVKLCGTCAGARGINDLQLIEGAELSTLNELAKLTVEADKVLTF